MLQRTVLFALLFAACVAATPRAAAETPARMVVTVEGHKGAALPEITRDDVMAYQNQQRLRVDGWDPVKSVQLWLLIDDGSNTALGSQLDDLRAFVRNQPASTRIGIGYMRNGSVQAAQGLTSDHDLAAKAIRLPSGIEGISASPYISLSDLIRKWPDTSEAREVLMITSGIDPYYGPGPLNPYLKTAIDTAQRAGVIVNAIYFASSGHLGHSYWEINWGQNNLAQICDETGGEFYWQGMYSPVSLAPYLDQLAQRLKRQYMLTFQPQGKPGFQRIRLTTEVPGAALVGPSGVYVPQAPK